MTVDAVMAQIDALTGTEQYEVYTRLADCALAADDPAGLSEGMKELLDERLADYKANPDDVCTWEEVIAYVKRKKCPSPTS